MKKTFRILAFLFTVCAAAGAQVTPSATGPGSPQGTLPTGSNLQYALRYSQAGDFVSGVGNLMLATASGSLNYMSGSERLPLNVDYTGGYTFSMTGPSYETGQFHRLFLSQGVVWRKWKVLVDDDASYLPEAPTTGFSGIPGIGEPIGVTNPAPVSGQSILTLNTHVIENIANGSLSHNLGSVTTISIGGSSALLRYPNGDGLDTTTESGTAGFVRNFNSRNALSANYLYSSFSYPGYSVTFVTNTGMVGYQYKWSRSLSTNIGAGPQVITSSIPATVPNFNKRLSEFVHQLHCAVHVDKLELHSWGQWRCGVPDRRGCRYGRGELLSAIRVEPYHRPNGGVRAHCGTEQQWCNSGHLRRHAGGLARWPRHHCIR